MSFLSKRLRDDGLKEYVETAGVPQGSVLGPVLWNKTDDGKLGVRVPKEATLISFPGDLAVVVDAKHLQDVVLYTSETIQCSDEFYRSMRVNELLMTGFICDHFFKLEETQKALSVHIAWFELTLLEAYFEKYSYKPNKWYVG